MPLTEEEIQAKNTAEEKGKVAFTAAENAKIDAIVREAMGRAGNDARAKAAQLEKDNEQLRLENELLKGTPQERESLQKEVEEKKAELAKTQAETLQMKKENHIREVAAKVGFIDADQVLKLTGDSIEWNEQNKVWAVADKSGALYGTDDNPLSVTDYLESYGKQHPNLVRGEVKSGTGATGSRNFNANPQSNIQRLKSLFGKGSNSALANKMAINSPQEYRQLKAEAQKLRII